MADLCFVCITGRGGLVVRSRLWDQRVPGSRPDSTEDPSCIGPIARSIIRRGPNVLPLLWCYTTHLDPAYPTGFKALKSRRGRELTNNSRRTPAPLAFIKIYPHIYILHPQHGSSFRISTLN
ncbi:hypothetical protein AVEN_207489-1 [Araneus ventricosus]|uniref:Uncharacterized protein n=1 Tax=Araneus ventricosus TaxID=182803 RepID=A0A4Y2EFV7_ARAVE|nr:hypothetical protein AVEN_207489-1 [Araneus ventricosus]